MDLIRAQSEDRGCPGTAPVPVGNHLALVDHRHVVMRLQVRHFHRGGLHPAERHADLFFSRYQRAGHIRQVQRFKLFRRQQAKRAQVQAAARAVQALNTFIGLAGIGRPQVKEEMPLHLPRQGIQVPVVFRDRVQQRCTDPPFTFPGRVRLLLQADQSRVLLQQPPQALPGELLFQRVEDQPRSAVSLPPYSSGGCLPGRQAHCPAGVQFRELFPGFCPHVARQ